MDLWSAVLLGMAVGTRGQKQDRLVAGAALARLVRDGSQTAARSYLRNLASTDESLLILADLLGQGGGDA
jgi:hypothetical protein